MIHVRRLIAGMLGLGLLAAVGSVPWFVNYMTGSFLAGALTFIGMMVLPFVYLLGLDLERKW